MVCKMLGIVTAALMITSHLGAHPSPFILNLVLLKSKTQPTAPLCDFQRVGDHNC